MPTRSEAACLVVLGVLGFGTITLPSTAQERAASPKGADNVSRERTVRKQLEEDEPSFEIWRQKAQLELDVLQAKVEAKKAEIQLREAEHRAQRLAPDLAILSKLDARVSMSFPNATTLEDVLKYIKNATTGANDNGIPIYVDPGGLAKVEKTLTSPVTLDLEGVPLKTTLRLVLKQLGLTYTVKDGLLKITAERDQQPDT